MSSRQNPAQPQPTIATLLGAGILAVGSMLISGCGTPGAPQPPSLNLPEPVADLTAVRAGSTVALHWTMPKKTVDHLLIKASVPVTVCWREASGPCETDGTASVSPDGPYDFRAELPTALMTGKPRPVSFFVELKSSKGRSAGLSNPALVLAGQAPGPVAGLTIQANANGAALQWSGNEPTVVRLHRKLLTPPAPKASQSANSGPFKSPSEPPLRDLLVTPETSSAEGALDKTARFGEEYEYTAQRILQIAVEGKTMELAGEISAPVRIQMVDTFPPTIPQGLVAVFVPEEKTIDLSWEPDADPDIDQDLAGYIVYRAERDAPEPEWKRISPAQPLTGTSFRDTAVVAGQSYRYAVTAIDQTGHESKRSKEADEATEAMESAPNP